MEIIKLYRPILSKKFYYVDESNTFSFVGDKKTSV